MTAPIGIALAGAGLIGQRHAEAMRAVPEIALASVIDPSEAGEALAALHGVPWHRDIEAGLAARNADAVLLATPNRLHAEGARSCVEAGIPVLVEKPIADDLATAREMVAAAEAAGVPLAVGHHRRHNPLIVAAKSLIDEGRLGTISAVEGTTWFRKPEDYFDTDWRRRPGAGPILINLIHDIDLFQHLVGPILRVQAMSSNAVRGFEVEDTAALTLAFENGALGTVILTDAAAAPWSWELTSAENPAYPATSQDCYRIGGTEAALALPSLTLWRHDGTPSWWAPISATNFPAETGDPLVRQLAQFARVVRGEEAPLVTGADGLSALAVIEAVKTAAAEGKTVEVAR